MTDREKIKEALHAVTTYKRENFKEPEDAWRALAIAIGAHLNVIEDTLRNASQADTKPAGGEITVSQEFIDQLWTNAQEIAYHAEMDTVKGKRRGHWILPKAMEVIKAVEQYATPPLTRKENGE